ncbi:MAG: Calcium-independent phospholipase A2-gamma [Bogoriella megaspora]|nr:MAG: Calcium-independent phospholipase A2-gamma [Bogoriella megaspora]
MGRLDQSSRNRVLSPPPILDDPNAANATTQPRRQLFLATTFERALKALEGVSNDILRLSAPNSTDGDTSARSKARPKWNNLAYSIDDSLFQVRLWKRDIIPTENSDTYLNADDVLDILEHKRPPEVDVEHLAEILRNLRDSGYEARQLLKVTRDTSTLPSDQMQRASSDIRAHVDALLEYKRAIGRAMESISSNEKDFMVSSDQPRLVLSLAFQNALEAAVDEHGSSDPGEKWEQNRFALPSSQCKTAVLALASQEDARDTGKYIFRSYRHSTRKILGNENSSASEDHIGFNPGPIYQQKSTRSNPAAVQRIANGSDSNEGFLTWQVAHATCAASFYFEPFKFKDMVFLGGGLLSNNPSFEAVREVRQLGTRDQDVVLISIGSATDKGPGARQSRRPSFSSALKSKFKAIVDAATDVSSVHDFLNSSAEEGALSYWRFNVPMDIELQFDDLKVKVDNQRKSSFKIIREQTEKYLKMEEVEASLKKCASMLAAKRRTRL